ncbi:MAG: FTR1 family protein [Polyangiaceae bacterium]|nr:FTR1 family protein [Polyangiaceae bacterium]MCE7889163.1 hypothetical protein [Sorangiineae bacterium PRO1]MCL4755628.1 FTR1 family protein [Myxococcales bacterium]
MLPTIALTFREGLEAFMVVAITIAYLRKAGRSDLSRVARLAVVLSIAVSVGAGWLFGQAENRPLWEGILALVAAVTIAPLTVYMLRHGRAVRGKLEQGLERRLQHPRASSAVFFFVLLMVTREGMETSLLFSTLLFSVGKAELVVGALIGVGASAALATACSQYGHRLQLGRLLQMTGVFLLVFLVQLSIVGLHELAEARVLPHSEELHLATEAYGPTGKYGEWLSYLLVLAPLAWLLISMVRGRRSSDVLPVSIAARNVHQSRPGGSCP